MGKTKMLLIFILVGLIQILPAAAQDADTVKEKQKQKEFELYTMATVTVTADAPQASEVTKTTEITASEIKASNASTAAEALALAPALRVSIGRKNESSFSLHGFDQSRILILIDGVPYYETNYGKLDLTQIPADIIARIDITKGAASVLYGANALGGVINIITKKATDKPFTGGIVEFGDNSTQRYSVNHGATIGIVNYWLSASHRTSDGWDLSSDYKPYQGVIAQKSPNKNIPAVLEDGGHRANSDYKATDVWAKVGVEPNADSAYYVNLHYLDLERGMPPATDTNSVFLNRPNFSQFGRTPVYRDRGADFDVKQRLGAGFVIKGKLFYHDHNDDYDSYTDLSYTKKIAKSQYKDYVAGGSVIAEAILGAKDTLRFALNYRTDSHQEHDDTYLPFAQTKSLTGSGGVENHFKVNEKLSLLAGVSFDWFRVTSAKRNITNKNGDFINQEALKKPSTDSFNPMAGISYQLGTGSSLFASIGRKTRFPTLQQLYSSKGGNTELKPERTTSTVVGLNQTIGDKANVQTSLFWHDVTNLISRDGSTSLSNYLNYAKVRMLGFEVEAQYDPSESFTLRGNWMVLDSQDRSSNRVTDRIRNAPRNKGGFGISYRLHSLGLRFDLNELFVGETYSSLPTPKYPTDPTRKTDSYFLTDLRCAKELGQSFEVYLFVRNLFDRNYQPDWGFPAPGRSWSLGISAKI